ncbi:hypothetical protein P9112_005927 [Eukaryota sp. TZLM1-RC]
MFAEDLNSNSLTLSNVDHDTPVRLPNTCIFCSKDLTESVNGRPVLFCKSCTAKDTLRPPVKVPVDTSPASSTHLSLKLRKFSSQLRNNNNWVITDLWKFFAKKKSLLKKPR